MNLRVSPDSFISLTLIITGLTISLVLWRFAKADNRSNRILSVAIMIMTTSVAIRFISQTYLIYEIPYLYIADGIAPLVSSGLIFLYVVSVAHKIGHQRSDIFDAVPLWFYLISFLPFLILAAIEKVQLALKHLSDFKAGLSERLAPSGFQFDLQYLVMLFFIFLQWRILLLVQKRATGNIAGSRLELRSWLTYLTASQTLGFLPLFIRPQDPDAQWILSAITLNMPIPVTTIWLFLRPRILYGLHAIKSEPERSSNGNGEAQVKPKVITTMTPHQQQFSDQLYNHMLSTKSYLQHRYTINRLAADLNIPPHQISAFLNQEMSESFSEFLNRFRIEYCIERIKSGDGRRLTLEALASECGFNNRNSFTAAFKRITGVTPSEFMRQLA